MQRYDAAETLIAPQAKHIGKAVGQLFVEIVSSSFRLIADISVHRHDGRMDSYSKGFTAPSALFPGATISLECVRYFNGDRYVSVDWVTNVFAQDGGWVDHEHADNVQDTFEAMVTGLASFYDGTALWLDNETGEKLTFWEMAVRTTPTNLGPP